LEGSEGRSLEVSRLTVANIIDVEALMHYAALELLVRHFAGDETGFGLEFEWRLTGCLS
jgi:hypothetical protein